MSKTPQAPFPWSPVHSSQSQMSGQVSTCKTGPQKDQLSNKGNTRTVCHPSKPGLKISLGKFSTCHLMSTCHQHQGLSVILCDYSCAEDRISMGSCGKTAVPAFKYCMEPMHPVA
jgi:hypothetical protein